MPLTRDEDIAELLASTRTIAMIGASDRPDRPSYGVMRYLQERGYRVFPVNPQITGEHVHGEYVWRELSQIGEPIDMVDIFRRPLAAGEAVDEAIAAGGSTLRNFASPDGELGYFPKSFAVYDREGRSCTCGGTVRRIVQGGRSTFYCPSCQH